MLCSDLSSVAGGLGSVLLVLVLCSGTFLILKKRKRKSGTGNSLFVDLKSFLSVWVDLTFLSFRGLFSFISAKCAAQYRGG